MAEWHLPWKRRAPRKSGLSIEEINGIVRIMDENRLTEVTFQEKDRILAVKRGTADLVGTRPTPAVDVPRTTADDGLTAITSPTVGIFYSSAAPGEPAFIHEGQIVEPDQVIALIETLKVMSEVRSRICGRVVSIEAGDGELVEFGQTLVLCEEID
ncbi:MAG: acetyl-CoA carboxylase biotin carboxyl carrier protein [Candidatus Geothermincolia bacterium]